MVVRINQLGKFQTIQTDCNKKSGEESTLYLMLPQILSEKAQLKKIARNRKLQLWPNPELIFRKPSRGFVIQITSGCNKNADDESTLTFTYKKNAKYSNFDIVQISEHATRLLKLVNTICKYENDPASTVENTERTRLCPHTDG